MILAITWLILAWRNPPSAVPKASISLISYTNITLIVRDTNIGVYPGPGSWVRTRLILTNEGNVSISYAAWGDEPYGDVSVQTDEGSTNGYMAPHFTGGDALLKPGCAARFWAIIPTNTQQWQCSFEVETASVRQRTVWRLIDGKYLQKIYQNLPEKIADKVLYPINWLPNKSGPVIVVKSPLFNLTNSIVAPP